MRRVRRERPDNSFFPTVSASGYKIEKPGPRQQFTFRYRYRDDFGQYTTAEQVLERCAALDAKIEEDRIAYDRVKKAVRAHERERRERDRALNAQAHKRRAREQALDSYYGTCYGAHMSDIMDAYREARACESWD